MYLNRNRIIMEPKHVNDSARRQFNRILVPVDFTDYSENACLFAIALASSLKAEVEVMHAYYTPEITSLPYDETFSFQGTLAEYLSENKERARENLDAFIKRMKDYSRKVLKEPILIGSSLLRGLPAEAVLYMTENYKPDLIVVGTHSTDKRKESASSMVRIIQEVRIPVIVVPENCDYRDLNRIRHVGYATDFDESDFFSMKKLIDLVSSIQPTISCVHVGQQPITEEEKARMDGLKEYFHKIYPSYTLECKLVEQKDVIEGLDAVIRDQNIDLLSLTTRRRNLISKIIQPSVTKKMFFQTNIPMLVFHS